MSVTDQLGLYVTGADAAALGQYEKALHELQCYVGDPVASVDAALAEAPELVMGHVLKGYLFGAVHRPRGRRRGEILPCSRNRAAGNGAGERSCRRPRPSRRRALA